MEPSEQLDTQPLATVNPDAVEPNQYFQVLKSNVKVVDTEQLQKQLDTVAGSIIQAKKIGQKAMLDRLSFTYDVVAKEQALLLAGFKRFVYQKDVEFLLDKSKHIKIIELTRYPRVIPPDNMTLIEQAKALEIFQEYVVVFTDMSGKDYKTEEEKQYVARNKDPVVFGMFRHKQAGFVHDRFYFITDWEDELCHLTFGKMIEEMAKAGIKNPDHEISSDHDYVKELVHHNLEELDNKKSNTSAFVVTTPVTYVNAKIPLYKRFRAWFQKP